MKILVTRTDRLGDVVLALPALSLLRAQSGVTNITFLAQPWPLEAIEPYLNSINIEGTGNANMEDYDAVLFLHYDAPLARTARRAKIYYRIGLHSKPLSFFTLSHGIRQKRSEGLFNEAYYNLKLAQYFLQSIGKHCAEIDVSPIEIAVNMSAEANSVFEELDLFRKSYVVLHPGTGGSALNAPIDAYLKIIKALGNRGIRCIISIGPANEDQRIRKELIKSDLNLEFLENKRLSTMREVYRQSLALIAPSTGTLHLAHYTGARTIGIYSPIKSQHQTRWAPWGGSGKSTVLCPDVPCPATRRCLGVKCRYYPCMETFPWSQKIEEALMSVL